MDQRRERLLRSVRRRVSESAAAVVRDMSIREAIKVLMSERACDSTEAALALRDGAHKNAVPIDEVAATIVSIAHR